MATTSTKLAPVAQVCTRCDHPEDLLPIQQAIVLRTFHGWYSALLAGTEPCDRPFRPSSTSTDAPRGWTLYEHVTYVDAMFAAVYIRLCDVLGKKRLDPARPVVGPALRSEESELQAALGHLGDQAERLALTIVAGASGRDWRALGSQGGTSPHDLVHRAIDEATEHLREAEASACLAAASDGRSPSPAYAHTTR